MIVRPLSNVLNRSFSTLNAFTDLRHFNATSFVYTKIESVAAEAIVIPEELQKWLALVVVARNADSGIAAKTGLVQVIGSSVAQEE